MIKHQKPLFEPTTPRWYSINLGQGAAGGRGASAGLGFIRGGTPDVFRFCGGCDCGFGFAVPCLHLPSVFDAAVLEPGGVEYECYLICVGGVFLACFDGFLFRVAWVSPLHPDQHGTDVR